MRLWIVIIFRETSAKRQKKKKTTKLLSHSLIFDINKNKAFLGKGMEQE